VKDEMKKIYLFTCLLSVFLLVTVQNISAVEYNQINSVKETFIEEKLGITEKHIQNIRKKNNLNLFNILSSILILFTTFFFLYIGFFFAILPWLLLLILSPLMCMMSLFILICYPFILIFTQFNIDLTEEIVTYLFESVWNFFKFFWEIFMLMFTYTAGVPMGALISILSLGKINAYEGFLKWEEILLKIIYFDFNYPNIDIFHTIND
jgi:hypothetical protein